MIEEYKREILLTFWLLLIARILLLVANTFNPLLYQGVGERLTYVLMVLGGLSIALHIPYDKRVAKKFISRPSKKKWIGFEMNVLLGLAILGYVAALLLEELEIDFMSSTAILVICVFFAGVSLIYRHNPGFKTFLAYSIVLGIVWGAYMFVKFEGLGYLPYVLAILSFLILVTIAWVVGDEK